MPRLYGRRDARRYAKHILCDKVWGMKRARKFAARSTSPINLELESRERIGDWNPEPGLLTKFVPTRRLAPAAVLV